METLKSWPRSMLTTATHDTKRSEDVRARLGLLSEIPDQWAAAVTRWAEHNQRHKQNDWPDRNFEYALYQTLFGAWPLSLERALGYAEKAMREAKAFTSWTQPRPEYEDVVHAFVKAIFEDQHFVRDLEGFLEPLLLPGWINSLTQTLTKLTTPGVPDVYQGCELWDYSLVDPDNRRPVDFVLRRTLLEEIDSLTPEQIMARAAEGLPKLWLTRQALLVRRRRPEWFGPDGSYSPLWATGTHGKSVLAFVRGGECLVAAPLRRLKIAGRWEDTALELPAAAWRNELTGETVQGGAIKVADLWGRFPVALLVRVT
jgi:(1->4)-alpha-D-glucan 1-alpha-D-glucosylmutase